MLIGANLKFRQYLLRNALAKKTRMELTRHH
jgi:hypothetical protein